MWAGGAALLLGCGEPHGGGRGSARDAAPGEVLDQWKGVQVRANGPSALESHGRHYEYDASGEKGQDEPVVDGSLGYYFGQKWQCVEFIKRYYFQALGHRMPDVLGHALDFFDWETPCGAVNPKRGLVQFCNGSSVPPQADDLLVFARPSGFGHVAIATRTIGSGLEVIQQNAGRTRCVLPLDARRGRYWLSSRAVCLGWLRKEKGPSGAEPPGTSPP